MDQDKGLPDGQALGQAIRKVFIQSMDHSALQQEVGSTNKHTWITQAHQI